MASNQAAWIDAQNLRLRIGRSDMPVLGPDDVLVRNHAVAINPVDWKIQDTGIFVKKWPTILGSDIAGEIVDAGSSASQKFKKGDRVAAHTMSVFTEPQDGGFQLYSRTQIGKVAKIPDLMSYTDASVLPLGLDTGVAGLYGKPEKGFFDFPWPMVNPEPFGKTILVWGGSSSVGISAIQLAIASGVTVIATAGQNNLQFCKDAGAVKVINYKSASVVDDTVSAIKQADGEFAGVFDAISVEDLSYKYVLQILEKLGGGNLTCVLWDLPKNVPDNVVAGTCVAVDPVTWKFWPEHLTPLLDAGVIKCLPPPVVVGKGLESIQRGLDMSREGVSAKKVVIEL